MFRNFLHATLQLSQHTGGCHAIASQQYETVMGRPLSICQSSEHVNVWHVEWRQQQVAGKPHKLEQAYLQNEHNSHILTHR